MSLKINYIIFKPNARIEHAEYDHIQNVPRVLTKMILDFRGQFEIKGLSQEHLNLQAKHDL